MPHGFNPQQLLHIWWEHILLLCDQELILIIFDFFLLSIHNKAWNLSWRPGFGDKGNSRLYISETLNYNRATCNLTGNGNLLRRKDKIDHIIFLPSSFTSELQKQVEEQYLTAYVRRFASWIRKVGNKNRETQNKAQYPFQSIRSHFCGKPALTWPT